MTDNNPRQGCSSPFKRSGESKQGQLGNSNNETNHTYQKNASGIKPRESEVSSFDMKGRSSTKFESLDEPKNNDLPRPVYGKRFRLLDQVKRKSKPTADVSWEPAKNRTGSKGNYRNMKETTSLNIPQKNIDTLNPERKDHHPFLETSSTKQIHCLTNEHQDLTKKVRKPSSCYDNPDCTTHNRSVANSSTPKCSSSEKLQKAVRQVQIGSREKAKSPNVRSRKPVHSVTVMPLSFKSGKMEVEKEDYNEETTSFQEPPSSYVASARENHKPKGMSTLSSQRLGDVVTGMGQEMNFPKDIMPVEQSELEIEKQLPIKSDNKHQQNCLDTTDYPASASNSRVKISKRECFSPHPSSRKSIGEIETTNNSYQQKICSKTGELAKHDSFPIINISEATPPQSPQSEQENLLIDSNSRSKTPQQIPIEELPNHHFLDNIPRSPRQSPQPFLNTPDGEGMLISRRKHSCSSTIGRSKSPFYMKDVRKRSKSPQNNGQPNLRLPKNSSQRRSPTAWDTSFAHLPDRRSPFDYQLNVSPGPICQSPGADALVQHSKPEHKFAHERSPLPQHTVPCTKTNIQLNCASERHLRNNSISPILYPMSLPLSFSPVCFARLSPNVCSPYPSNDVSHPNFTGSPRSHHESLPKPFPREPQAMLSNLMPPIQAPSLESNNSKGTMSESPRKAKEENRFSTLTMESNRKSDNILNSGSAFRRSAFKSYAAAGHTEKTPHQIKRSSSPIKSRHSKLSRIEEDKAAGKTEQYSSKSPPNLIATNVHVSETRHSESSQTTNVKYMESNQALRATATSPTNPHSNPRLLIIPPPEFLGREKARSPSLFQNLESASLEFSASSSPVPHLPKRPRLSDVRSKDNSDISSQYVETGTTNNLLQGTKEKDAENTSMNKRKRSMNSDQGQFDHCLARPAKCMRTEGVPLALSPRNHGYGSGKADNLEPPSHQVNSHTLVETEEKTTIPNTETVVTGLASITITATKETYSSSKTVVAKDISTQTISTTMPTADSVGNKRDRKADLLQESLCTKSEFINVPYKHLPSCKGQRKRFFADAVRCQLLSIAEHEPTKQHQESLISKRYFHGQNVVGNSEKLKHTTTNRQQHKGIISSQQNQQEKHPTSPHSLPIPYISERNGRLSPLALPRHQINLNANSQRRSHAVEPNGCVLNPNEIGGCSPGLRCSINTQVVSNNQGNNAKFNLESGLLKGNDYCFPRFPQFCFSHPLRSKGNNLSHGRCQYLSSPKHSNCSCHNVTSTSSVSTHERGRIDSSGNKKDNTGNKPLRFHVMTNFPVRDTTSQKNSCSSSTASQKNAGNEKHGVGKSQTSVMGNNAITEKNLTRGPINTLSSPLKLRDEMSPKVKQNISIKNVNPGSEVDSIDISVSEKAQNTLPLCGTSKDQLLVKHDVSEINSNSEGTPETNITITSSNFQIKPTKNTFVNSIESQTRTNEKTMVGVQRSAARMRWQKLVRLSRLKIKRSVATKARTSPNQKAESKDVSENSSSDSIANKWSNCDQEASEKQICEMMKKKKREDYSDLAITRYDLSTKERPPVNTKEKPYLLNNSLPTYVANKGYVTFKPGSLAERKHCGSHTTSSQRITHYDGDTNMALDVFLSRFISASVNTTSRITKDGAQLSANPTCKATKVASQLKCVPKQEGTKSIDAATPKELNETFQSTLPGRATSIDVPPRRMLNNPFSHSSNDQQRARASNDRSFTQGPFKQGNVSLLLNEMPCKNLESPSTPHTKNVTLLNALTKINTNTTSLTGITTNASVKTEECSRLPFSGKANSNLRQTTEQLGGTQSPNMELTLNSKTSPHVTTVGSCATSCISKSLKPTNITRAEAKHESSLNQPQGPSMQEQNKTFKCSHNLVAFHTQPAQMPSASAQGSPTTNLKTKFTNKTSKKLANNEAEIAKQENAYTSPKLSMNWCNAHSELEPHKTESKQPNDQFHNTSHETRTLNTKHSKFLSNSVQSTFEKIGCRSTRETYLPINQTINSYGKPNKSVLDEYTSAAAGTSPSNSFRSNLLKDKSLTPTTTSDQVAHQKKQFKPVVSKKTNAISQASSITATLCSKTEVERVKSPWEMISRVHNGSLSETQLQNEEKSNPMGYLPSSETISALATSYIRKPQAILHTKSSANGSYAPRQENTSDPSKKLASGSLTNVTWAVLNDAKRNPLQITPSPKQEARATSGPADYSMHSETHVHTHSNISTKLTWLLTSCLSNKSVRHENQTTGSKQFDLETNQCNKTPQRNQAVTELKQEDCVNTCSIGQDKHSNSPCGAIKIPIQTSKESEGVRQFGHRSTANNENFYQKQVIEKSCQSLELLRAMKGISNNTSFGAGHITPQTPEQSSSENQSPRERPKTDTLTHPRKTPEMTENACQSRKQHPINQSPQTTSCLQGALPNSEQLPLSFIHHSSRYTTDERKAHDGRRQDGCVPAKEEQNISEFSSLSGNAATSTHEILDEFAGPEDCLPVINATFSLKDRPDIQEQIKLFGNQQHIEADSSQVKCLKKCLKVKK